MEIPSGPGGVTPEWLTAALRPPEETDGPQVVVHRCEVIGQGAGLLAMLARVELEWDRSDAQRPRSVIAKFPGAFAANRTLADTLGLYETEVRFYAEVASEVPIGVPACHAAVRGTTTDRFVLLLEDLGHLRAGDQIAGLSPADATAAAAAIARLHARWWRSPRLQTELAWAPRIDSPAWIETLSATSRAALPAFLDQYAGRVPSSLAAVLGRAVDRFEDVMRWLGQRPLTLCHGDFKADNFLFDDYAQEPLRVIDWQALARAPGPLDLAFLVASSVSPAVRQAHETRLVRAYHAALQAGGVSDYPLAACWRDYETALAWRSILNVLALGGGALDVEDARGQAMIAVTLERFLSIADDHDLRAIVDAV